MVDWSRDSEDSMGASAKKSNAMYTKMAKKYPAPQIVLNHETYKDTARKVTPHAVEVLQGAGYELMHVSECLGMGTEPEDLYQWVGEPSERDVRKSLCLLEIHLNLTFVFVFCLCSLQSSWTCKGTPKPGNS